MKHFPTTAETTTNRTATTRSLGVRAVSVLVAAVLVASCSGSNGDSADPADSSPDAEEAAAAESTTSTTTTAPDPDDPQFAEVRELVGDLIEEHELEGAGFIIFDRDDGIVFEDYWGEFDADRVSLLASGSKMISAGVLSRLADEGLLDLDEPIVNYVDWATDNPDITVAQLLSHSSGLVGLLPELTYPPYICQFVGDDMVDCAEQIFNSPDDEADVVPPDTEFRYGGGQWQVAGAVAETVSGKSWDQLIQETYVEPCGVDSLQYNNHWLHAPSLQYPADLDLDTLEPTGNPHMEGGAFINAPDYVTLLLMHLRGGECPNGSVMSAEAIEQAHTDRLGSVNGDTNTGYGIGWWINHETGRVYNNGAYGAVAWLDEEEGYGAYLIIESDSGVGHAIASELYEPVEEVALARR